ncbi:hypothetical protein GCM10027321_32230 [Massilia terrae]
MLWTEAFPDLAFYRISGQKARITAAAERENGVKPPLTFIVVPAEAGTHAEFAGLRRAISTTKTVYGGSMPGALIRLRRDDGW